MNLEIVNSMEDERRFALYYFCAWIALVHLDVIIVMVTIIASSAIIRDFISRHTSDI